MDDHKLSVSKIVRKSCHFRDLVSVFTSVPLQPTGEVYAVPSAPQLHTEYVGPHLLAFDVNRGSLGHALTCPAVGYDFSQASHPRISFDLPVATVHAVMTNGKQIIWDAFFNAAGGKELSPALNPSGGALPYWPRICVPEGKTEMFNVDFHVTTPQGQAFDSKAQFTAERQLQPPLPQPPALTPIHILPTVPDTVNTIPFSVRELVL